MTDGSPPPRRPWYPPQPGRSGDRTIQIITLGVRVAAAFLPNDVKDAVFDWLECWFRS